MTMRMDELLFFSLTLQLICGPCYSCSRAFFTPANWKTKNKLPARASTLGRLTVDCLFVQYLNPMIFQVNRFILLYFCMAHLVVHQPACLPVKSCSSIFVFPQGKHTSHTDRIGKERIYRNLCKCVCCWDWRRWNSTHIMSPKIGQYIEESGKKGKGENHTFIWSSHLLFVCSR